MTYADQIRDLQEGDHVRLCFDGNPNGSRDDDSRVWGQLLTIAEVTHRGINVHGNPYVYVHATPSDGSPGGYWGFGIGCEDNHIRILPQERGASR